MKKVPHSEAIGLSGHQFEFDVERGKVREFANTLFAFRPEYLEGKHPPIFPIQLVVASYLWGYMLENPMGTPLEQVDINYNMSLDGEQEFVFPDGPPLAGETLLTRTWVDNIWEKQSSRAGTLTFYKMRSDFTDADGNLRAIHYSTSLVPDRVPDDDPPPETEAGLEPVYMKQGEKREHFMQIEQMGWEDLLAGKNPGSIDMPPLTLTEQVCYQIVSGNYGAGHHDTASAQADGYRDWFSIGMFHAGLLATYAVNWLGPYNIRSIKFRFHDMMWPGDPLSDSGKVVETAEVDGERLVHIELACTHTVSQAVTVKAWATFVVP